MEAWRYLLPSEVHDGHEGGLHEEGHDTLDGQWRSEDVTYKPGVVRPVGAKLKLQNDTCSNAHGEVNAEETLPKLGRIAPECIAGAVPTGLDDTHHYGETQRQGHEEPVIDGCQCELRSCPVDGPAVNG